MLSLRAKRLNLSYADLPTYQTIKYTNFLMCSPKHQQQIIEPDDIIKSYDVTYPCEYLLPET
jgi:hypothetical protein